MKDVFIFLSIAMIPFTARADSQDKANTPYLDPSHGLGAQGKILNTGSLRIKEATIKKLQKSFSQSPEGFKIVKNWLSKNSERKWSGLLDLEGKSFEQLASVVVSQRKKETDDNKTLNDLSGTISAKLEKYPNYRETFKSEILEGKIKPAMSKSNSTPYFDVYACENSMENGVKVTKIVADIGGYLFKIQSTFDNAGKLKSREFQPVYSAQGPGGPPVRVETDVSGNWVRDENGQIKTYQGTGYVPGKYRSKNPADYKTRVDLGERFIE